ncbi:hypothetical protein [Borrelia sp. RT1S]|uniref:hypothetical protein n=1 Tax=Borrelia sp. RT1S TaxID=2898580 RepID=UPI001E46AFF6|nr:hypothetical protein [Borrelia sp. RT1S]UGQ17872.1 hypothetical protein LSO05_05420 [Borrelia sp. RT1S]
MNELGLKVIDFVNVYGSLLFEVILSYLERLKEDNPVSRIKFSHYFQLEQVVKKSSSPTIRVSKAEVDRFIESNLASSTGYVVTCEKILGNASYKDDHRVRYNALRVTAGDIVLTMGALSNAEVEIVRVRNDIVANYETRIRILESKRGVRPSGEAVIMRKSIISRKGRF